MKQKPKRQSIVVTVSKQYQDYIINGEDGLIACEIMHRAGLKPLKPGESRKVRVTVEDLK
jgi:hypothetical protein